MSSKMYPGGAGPGASGEQARGSWCVANIGPCYFILSDTVSRLQSGVSILKTKCDVCPASGDMAIHLGNVLVQWGAWALEW